MFQSTVLSNDSGAPAQNSLAELERVQQAVPSPSWLATAVTWGFLLVLEHAKVHFSPFSFYLFLSKTPFKCLCGALVAVAQPCAVVHLLVGGSFVILITLSQVDRL